MSGKSTLLLEHHLKELRLPNFLREYGKPPPLTTHSETESENTPHPPHARGQFASRPFLQMQHQRPLTETSINQYHLRVTGTVGHSGRLPVVQLP